MSFCFYFFLLLLFFSTGVFVSHAEINATRNECSTRSQDLEARITRLESSLTSLKIGEDDREYSAYDDLEYNEHVEEDGNQGLAMDLALFGGKKDLGRMGQDDLAERLQKMLSSFGGKRNPPRESSSSTASFIRTYLLPKSSFFLP